MGDPMDGTTGDGTSLREMLAQGDRIATHRNEDLFRELDGRGLTETELGIIAQRVALQRSMAEVFERRERARKLREIKTVCPDATDDEALAALMDKEGNEDEAALALSDPEYRQALQQNLRPVRQAAARASRQAPVTHARRKPAPALPADGVFVGSFRGRLGPKQVSAHAHGAGASGAGRGGASTDAGAFAEAVANGEDEAMPQPSDDGALHGAHAASDHDAKPENNAAHANGGADGLDEAVVAAPHADPMELDGHAQLPSRLPEVHAASADVDAAAATTTAVAADAPAPHVIDPWSDEHAFKDTAAQTTGPKRGGTKKWRAADAATVADDDGAAAPPSVKKPRTSGARRPKPVVEAAAQEPPLISGAAAGDVTVIAGADTAAMEVAMPPGATEEPAAGTADDQAAPVAPTSATAAPAPTTKTVREVDIDALPDAPAELTREQLEGMVNDWCGRQVSKSKLHRKKLAALLPDGVLAAAVAAHQAGQPLPQRPEGTAPACKALPMRTRTVVVNPTPAKAAAAPAGEEDGDAIMAAVEGEGAPAAVKKAPAQRKKKAVQPAPVAPAVVVDMAGVDAPAPCVDAAPPPQTEDVHKVEEGGAAPDAPVVAEQTVTPPVVAQARRGGGGASRAPAAGGKKPLRGRCKRGSVKSAELVHAGKLVLDDGWHNAGYIFPDGFTSRTVFRSSVALDQLCIHECSITSTGICAPMPTFRITAADRPDEPLEGKSATKCWTMVLARINGEIERRREEGEDWPPPPKTAIAGPEYFGLNTPDVVAAIEALDPEHKCTDYWAGKEAREDLANDPEGCAERTATAAAAEQGAAARPPKARRAPRAGGASGRGGKRRRKGGAHSDSDLDVAEGVDEEAVFASRKWSAINRGERARARAGGAGEAAAPDDSNPCADLIDPITLEPVVNPAISPYGHVMGMATWSACLSESDICPLTKMPLRTRDLVVLTHNNIERFRDKIVR